MIKAVYLAFCRRVNIWPFCAPGEAIYNVYRRLPGKDGKSRRELVCRAPESMLSDAVGYVRDKGGDPYVAGEEWRP